MQEIHHHALLRHSGDQLRRIDPQTWEGFCLGTLPLTNLHGVSLQPGTPRGDRPGNQEHQLIDILFLTLRQDEFRPQPILELVEPFRLSIDEHGFLMRLHVNLEPLADPGIIDLRPLLVTGYLRRAYQWRPSVALIGAAMTMCGLHSTPDVRQRTPG